MKTLIILPFILMVTNFTFGQKQSKNNEHCKYVINKKNSDRLETVFQISTLTETQKNNLIDLLYKKNENTYNVEIKNNNTISIFHISTVSAQYFKEYLISQNCFLSFIGSTVITNSTKF